MPFFYFQILHRKNTSISSEGKTHEGVLTKIFYSCAKKEKNPAKTQHPLKMHIQINRSYKTEGMLEEPRNERCLLLLCSIFDVFHHLACVQCIIGIS